MPWTNPAFVLDVVAIIFTILAGISPPRIPLWIPVLLLALSQLIVILAGR